MNSESHAHRDYIDLLRVIAILLVILNHIDINYYYYHNTSSYVTFTVSLLVTVLCRIDVPIFFMISGALLLPKQESTKSLYKKRVLKTFIVLLVFSALQYIILSWRGKIDGFSLLDFIQRFVSGTIQEPYWFLYFYLGFLIMLPLLRPLAQNLPDKGFIYIFVIRVILDFVIPYAPLVLGAELSQMLLSPLNTITSDLAYFLMGYYIENRMHFDDRTRAKSGIVFSLGVLIPVVYVTFIFIIIGSIREKVLSPYTFITTVAFYTFIKSLYMGKEKDPQVKFLAYLADLVFGVYLIESMVRMLYIDLYRYLISVTYGLIASFVYFAVTAVTSFLLVFIFKKISARFRK